MVHAGPCRHGCDHGRSPFPEPVVETQLCRQIDKNVDRCLVHDSAPMDEIRARFECEL